MSDEVDVQKREKLDMKTIKRLFQYMKVYKVKLMFVLICILLSVFANVATSMFTQILVDGCIVPMLGQEHPIYTKLIISLTVLSGICLVGVIAQWLYSRAMVVVAQGVLKDIRDEMFKRMQSLPINYFDQNSNGDMMSLYTNDTDTLRQLIAHSVSQVISSVVTLVAVFACMMYLSVYLTVLVIFVMLFVFNLIKMLTKNSAKYFGMQQDNIAELDGFIEEMIAGQKVVKVFCHEKKCQEIFNQKNEKWKQSSAKANIFANSMMPMMNAVGYIQYVLIAVIGAWFAISRVTNFSLTGFGYMSLGMIMSFLILSRNFNQPIAQISNQFNSIVMALAGVSRIFRFMDEEAEQDDGNVTLVNAEEVDGKWIETAEMTHDWAWKQPQKDGTVKYTKLCGEVVLDHVSFNYVPGKEVLSDVSFYAKPGQKVALVGATGAGKTTIANLINRFYDICDGAIYYDGINIKNIKKADLRRSIGMVLQDVNLFTGSVMDNIRYGSPKASDEKCISAAKIANADHFIKMLPDGYDTLLEESGSELSQGQRQLLSISRAEVSDPPVMVLDEATSSIDTCTEVLVQDGMDKVMKGRTVFVIAHRLSTVRNADVILVLDHGKVIERGSHEHLLSLKGVYYQLYSGVFELS